MRLSTPGQAISLRDWELGDLEPFRFVNIGHHRWMDLNGPYYPRPTVDELDEQIVAKAKLIAANDWTTPRTQQVITNEANEFLGMVSWYWQSQETRWLSIGLVIYDEANWRQGIGYQALRIWCQYLLDQQPELARLDLLARSLASRLKRDSAMLASSTASTTTESAWACSATNGIDSNSLSSPNTGSKTPNLAPWGRNIRHTRSLVTTGYACFL